MEDVWTSITLIRHGRTAWNAEGRFLGRTDLPLDALGRSQAEAGARRLAGRFDVLYHSGLSRAQQTAEALGPAVAEPGFAELDQGDLEGLEVAAAVERFPAFFAAWADDPGGVAPPGSSQTLRGLQHHALAGVQRLALRHPGERIGVVTHQLVMASVACAIAEAPLQAWRRHRVDNLGVITLGWKGHLLRVPEAP